MPRANRARSTPTLAYCAMMLTLYGRSPSVSADNNLDPYEHRRNTSNIVRPHQKRNRVEL